MLIIDVNFVDYHCKCWSLLLYMIHVLWRDYMSYEEEDTCHMRRRIHVR